MLPAQPWPQRETQMDDITPATADESDLIDAFRSLFDYTPETGILSHKGDYKPITEDTSAEGYLRVRVNGRLHAVHRIAWGICHGSMPSMLDHINGIRHDNRLENLRVATNAENSMNRRPNTTKCLTLKGVSFHRRSKTYRARIMVNRSSHWLGQFKCQELAALAYDRAAVYFFGEFALTNFMLGLLPSQKEQ